MGRCRCPGASRKTRAVHFFFTAGCAAHAPNNIIELGKRIACGKFQAAFLRRFDASFKPEMKGGLPPTRWENRVVMHGSQSEHRWTTRGESSASMKSAGDGLAGSRNGFPQRSPSRARRNSSGIRHRKKSLIAQAVSFSIHYHPCSEAAASGPLAMITNAGSDRFTRQPSHQALFNERGEAQ